VGTLQLSYEALLGGKAQYATSVELASFQPHIFIPQAMKSWVEAWE